LGYYGGIAFCHTAYGRLNLEKDDADVTLPWKDLLAVSSSPSSPSSDDNNNNNNNNNNKCPRRQKQSFGRINSLGMKIYRRLNIVVEEVSDVSRILLPVNNDATTTITSSSKKSSSSSQHPTTVSELLQRYDIISLQPMNEPALQSICELLLSSSSAVVNSAITASSSSSSSSANNNNSSNNNNNTKNASFIDILVLEYATGSRGGHGVPYKLRKDYLVKALQSGVTFELCYGTAILDAKRRQGFLRTLLDFQSTYNGIQKKHALLHSNHHSHSNRKTKCNVKFPLLLSSGARQNYTRGTDEGVLTLRTPLDVKLMSCHLVGGKSNGWFDDNNDKGGDDGDDDDDGMMHRDGKRKQRNHRKPVLVTSPAEKVLERAGDRASGVVVVRMGRSSKRQHATNRRCGRDGRSRVVGMKRTRDDNDDGDDDDDDDDNDGIVSSKGGSSASLIDWLSKPLHEKAANALAKEEDVHDKDSQDKMEGSKRVAVRDGLVNNDGGANRSSDRGSNDTVGRSLVLDKDGRPDSRGDEEEEDLEDGFIAL